MPTLDREMLAEPAVGGEGLALPSASIEGEHQLTPKRLAQRVLAHELLELRDESGVPTQRELGPDAELEGLQPALVEPERLGDGEGFIGQVRQRPPAPHSECSAQRGGCPVRIAVAEGRRPGADGALKAVHVDLVRIDREHVAGLVAHEQIRSPGDGGAGRQRASQPGDVGPQGRHPRRRRRTGPELVDEPVEAEHLTGVERE